jgi:hypothetical protein
LLENSSRSVVFSDLIFMELFPSLLDLPNLGNSISDNRTLLAVGTAIERQMSGENPTSQSPPVSPHKQFPPALKRKKLLESNFENEAGNGKKEEGNGDGLRVLVTLRNGILGMVWQEIKHRYLTGKNIKVCYHSRIK